MGASVQPQPQAQPAPVTAPTPPGAPGAGVLRHADGTVTTPQMSSSPPAPAPTATPPLPPSAQPLGGIQPQPQPVASGLDSRAILSGPNVPQALQGMNVGDALGVFQQMQQFAQNLVNQNRELTARLSGQPNAQPQTPGQAQAQAQTQSPAAGQPAFDWTKPHESIGRVVADVLRQQLPAMLAPVTAPMVQQGIAAAKQTVINEIGPQNWALYGPVIEAQLANADPQLAANAELWRTAFYVAKGRSDAIRSMQRPSSQPQPQGQWPMVVPQPQSGFPVQQPQGPAQPVPNLNSFFTEAPSGQGGIASALTPAQQHVARLFNLPEAQYAAAAGVNQPLNGSSLPGAF